MTWDSILDVICKLHEENWFIFKVILSCTGAEYSSVCINCTPLSDTTSLLFTRIAPRRCESLLYCYNRLCTNKSHGTVQAASIHSGKGNVVSSSS